VICAFVDDRLANEQRTAPDPGPAVWPFDGPFRLLLNVAVGGTWGGQQGVDPSIWPQRMEIDFVRVYERRTSGAGAAQARAPAAALWPTPPASELQGVGFVCQRAAPDREGVRLSRESVEPAVGLEPTTCRLRIDCSTN
jgi:hypothetical protein